MNSDPDFSSRLKRLGDEFEPDIEGRFGNVVRTADRRARTRRAATAIAETVVIALVAVVLLRVGLPSSGGQPSASPASRLSGAWTATLASSETAAVSNGLNGTWRIAFPGSGVLEVTAPPTYVGPSQGYAFQVSADTVRTDLLGADVCSSLPPGTYRYQQTALRLVFTTVDDDCPGRVALLTTSSWTPAR